MWCFVVFTVNDYNRYCHEREIFFVSVPILAGDVATREVILIIEFLNLIFEVANKVHTYYFRLYFIDYSHEIIATYMSYEISISVYVSLQYLNKSAQQFVAIFKTINIVVCL